jgi:hypothetical protein
MAKKRSALVKNTETVAAVDKQAQEQALQDEKEAETRAIAEQIALEK